MFSRDRHRCIFLEEKVPLSWRRTLFFFLVLVGIASVYYFKVREERPAEQTFSFSQESAKAYVLGLNDKELVNQLTIRDNDKKTELSFLKVGERNWRIV